MKRISWKTQTVLVIAVFATLGTSGAHAGNVLFFKSGVERVAPNGQNLKLHLTTLGDEAAQQRPRYYVVQYKTAIHPTHHRHLRSVGAKALRYIPDDALLVEATPATAEKLQSAGPDVNAVVPFRAKWKISGEFDPASVFSKGRNEKVFIRLLDAKWATPLQQELTKLGAKVEFFKGRSIVAILNRAHLERAAELEGIEWLQPNPQMELMHFRVHGDDDDAKDDEDGADKTAPTPEPTPEPNGDYTDLDGFESGAKLMNFETAWNRGFKGEGEHVAMADTGLDRGDAKSIHDDFLGRVSGQAFGMFAAGWEDPMGHGTHVAGSIAGDGRASGGLLVGGAPSARFLAQGLWSPLLGNLTVPPVISEMLSKAYDEGARVHSNSWGSPKNPGAYDGLAVQVDEYAFANPDFLILFAAGNSGADLNKDGRIDPNSVSSPGTAKNVLTVGASENKVAKGGIQKKLGELRGGMENWGKEPLKSDTLSDDPNGLAAFSSRGPTADGRTKPDLVAPGTNVLSTRSHFPDASTLWGAYNKDYAWSGGTSMSTPLVAGAAVLVREYLVKEKGFESPSSALVKNVLMHSSVDLFPGQFGAKGKAKGQELLRKRPNPDEGWGRVDVGRATGLTSALVFDEKTGVATDETRKYPLHISRAGKVIVSLVWTDAPGSPTVAKALVNDLDIAIVNASGRELAPRDRINNTELIEVSVGAGDYEVQVRGVNVPQGVDGRQPFALVISMD